MPYCTPASGEIPAESQVLDDAYRKSGLTAGDLAAATGISVGSVRIALSGIRYRTGKREVVAPPDQTLAKLATVLGISAQSLSDVGRGRAAALMTDAPPTPALSGVSIPGAVAARESLARQVLAAFSIDELQAEIDRRHRVDHERSDREAMEDMADELRAEQYPL